MSEPAGTEPSQDVQIFSECVIGYRSWVVGAGDELWPLSSTRRPWQPGINTARCNCVSRGSSLKSEWSWYAGRRVLEPAPGHPAPQGDCDCGLYSWRRPVKAWHTDARYASAQRVGGAVASWGRLQVHDNGFRAEHACVVTLGYPPGATLDAVAELERLAARYRVDLVALGELEQAASRHGSPLPDLLRPPPAEAPLRPGVDEAAGPPIAAEFVSAPDVSEDEVDRSVPAGRRRVRKRHYGLGLVVVLLALIVTFSIVDHRSTPCKLQITRISGTAGTLEQCVAVSHHHR